MLFWEVVEAFSWGSTEGSRSLGVGLSTIVFAISSCSFLPDLTPGPQSCYHNVLSHLRPKVTDDCGLEPLKSQVTSFHLLNCHRDLSHAQSLTNSMSKTGERVKSGRKAEAGKCIRQEVHYPGCAEAQSLADLGRLCISAQDDP